MNNKQLKQLTAVLVDAINDLDTWSVYNNDEINQEVSDLYLVGAKLVKKIHEEEQLIKDNLTQEEYAN